MFQTIWKSKQHCLQTIHTTMDIHTKVVCVLLHLRDTNTITIWLRTLNNQQIKAINKLSVAWRSQPQPLPQAMANIFKPSHPLLCISCHYLVLPPYYQWPRAPSTLTLAPKNDNKWWQHNNQQQHHYRIWTMNHTNISATAAHCFRRAVSYCHCRKTVFRAILILFHDTTKS